MRLEVDVVIQSVAINSLETFEINANWLVWL